MDRNHITQGIEERLADARLLWAANRRQFALLLALVAVAARSRLERTSLGDRTAFETYLGSTHDWTISVEFRGKQVTIDHLLYKWMRCELAHTASLPLDVLVDDELAALGELAVRAGGAPEYVVRISPAWFDYIYDAARPSP